MFASLPTEPEGPGLESGARGGPRPCLRAPWASCPHVSSLIPGTQLPGAPGLDSKAGGRLSSPRSGECAGYRGFQPLRKPPEHPALSAAGAPSLPLQLRLPGPAPHTSWASDPGCQAGSPAWAPLWASRPPQLPGWGHLPASSFGVGLDPSCGTFPRKPPSRIPQGGWVKGLAPGEAACGRGGAGWRCQATGAGWEGADRSSPLSLPRAAAGPPDPTASLLNTSTLRMESGRAWERIKVCLPSHARFSKTPFLPPLSPPPPLKTPCVVHALSKKA